MNITRESIKNASRPAGAGAIIGLLAAVAVTAFWSRGFEPGSIVLFIMLGAFISWWGWLLWGALMSSSRLKRCGALILYIGFATAIYRGEHGAFLFAERFRQDGAVTEGTVTGVFPENHNTIGYRYSVAGVDFSGIDSASSRATDFNVGDKIRVIYLRSEPATSVSSKRTDTQLSATLSSLFGSLWLVSGWFIISFYGRKASV
jgi:hypothetical protein